MHGIHHKENQIFTIEYVNFDVNFDVNFNETSSKTTHHTQGVRVQIMTETKKS